MQELVQRVPTHATRSAPDQELHDAHRNCRASRLRGRCWSAGVLGEAADSRSRAAQATAVIQALSRLQGHQGSVKKCLFIVLVVVLSNARWRRQCCSCSDQ